MQHSFVPSLHIYPCMHRPAVELGAILGQEAIVVEVDQISPLALWRALLRLEDNFNLHLVLLLLCCGPHGAQAELPGHKETQCAAHRHPHHAAVQSWQLSQLMQRTWRAPAAYS